MVAGDASRSRFALLFTSSSLTVFGQGLSLVTNTMWGGRFSLSPAAIMEEINASIDFDKRLWRHDIVASKAHAAMLAETGIITKTDASEIARGLDKIAGEIEAGTFAFSRALEDIHLNVESRLAELIGPVAGKLHTARSRNDQVATDFRLYVRDEIDTIDALLAGLQLALAETALAHAATVMPGFTHLQTGAAGDLRPSLPRLRRDVRPRPGTVPGCAEAPERIPARRRGPRRHRLPHRSRGDGEGARLCQARRQFARRRIRSRLRAGDAWPRRRSRRRICRALPKRSCCGPRRSSASPGSPTATRPAPRSCRRSGTRTRPSSSAPRPAASPAPSSPSSW